MPLTNAGVKLLAGKIVEAARGPEWQRIVGRMKAERAAGDHVAASLTLAEMTEHVQTTIRDELDAVEAEHGAPDMMRVAVAVNEQMARACGLA